MNTNHLQPVPVFLIVFGAISIAIGEHFGWHDLVTFAVGFGGAGVGILTGRFPRDTDVPSAPLTP